jgi:MFS family permease
MRAYRRAKRRYLASIVFFFLMSFTFLLMPLIPYFRSQILSYVLGVCFWLFLALGLLFAFLASSTVKNALWDARRGKEWNQHPIGLIAFGKNLYGLIADILCLLSLVAAVIVGRTSYSNRYIMYVLIFLAAFSFMMHCMLNGRTLRYLESLRTLRKVRKRSYEEH